MERGVKIADEFLISLLPEDLVDASKLLCSLNYPIKDKKSMASQLEKYHSPREGSRSSSENRSELASKILDLLQPLDFTIDTAQSALEKFSHRFFTNRSFSSHLFPNAPELDPYFDLGFSEPRETPPRKADFGTDACGRVATQLWHEHLRSSITMLFGPSLAYYDFLSRGADRCRQASSPQFMGLCGTQGEFTYARCIILGGSHTQCMKEALHAINLCKKRFTLENQFPSYMIPRYV